MFDTMTMTKALGAFCAALLVFLLGKWLADELYVAGSAKLPPAFVIDTGVEVDDVEVVELTFEEAYAMASADAGTRVWNQCRACHTLEDGRNGVGPHLFGLMGRQANAVDGFRYSGALPGDLIWDAASISAFVENPRAFASGTSMAYAGMASVTDRANLIAYIATFTPGYEPPAVPAAVEEAPAEEAPAEEAAVEEAPVEEAPVEEAAVEEAPVEEAPVEEAAVEEAPAEDAATEEAAADEAPAEEAAPAAEADSPIAAAFAQASVEDGARIWRQCQACHVADAETNRVGPHLVGMLGRTVNGVEGFRYSGRMPEGTWTLEKLDAFLENPRSFAPGTTMAFPGVRNLQDRANVIAYIDSLN